MIPCLMLTGERWKSVISRLCRGLVASQFARFAQTNRGLEFEKVVCSAGSRSRSLGQPTDMLPEFFVDRQRGDFGDAIALGHHRAAASRGGDAGAREGARNEEGDGGRVESGKAAETKPAPPRSR